MTQCPRVSGREKKKEKKRVVGARGSGRGLPQASIVRDHGHRSFNGSCWGRDGARQAISGACGVAGSPLAPSFPLPFPARL